VAYLLEIRLLLAPTYARQALETSSGKVAAYLKNAAHLNGDPAAYASFDWGLHHLLTSYAANPVFQLLLNGFHELYSQMGWKYFSFEECRTQSHKFYSHLLAIAESMDFDSIEIVMRNTMQGSLDLWLQLGGQE
jgi:DNA-binding FadR family transcriptional regulator